MKRLSIIILMLALLPPVIAAPNIMPIQCDGTVTNEFSEGDDICVYGTGFDPEQEVDIYVLEDKETYTEGEDINGLTEVTTIKTTSKGILKLSKLWTALKDGIIDLVADLNRNGKVDSNDVINAGNAFIQEDDLDLQDIEEVPEMSTIFAFLVLIGAGAFIYKKRGETL